MTLYSRIAEELKTGKTTSEIAMCLQTSKAYVSVVKSRLNGNGRSWKRLRESEKLQIAYLFGVGDHSIYDLSIKFQVSMKQIESLLGAFINEPN